MNNRLVVCLVCLIFVFISFMTYFLARNYYNTIISNEKYIDNLYVNYNNKYISIDDGYVDYNYLFYISSNISSKYRIYINLIENDCNNLIYELDSNILYTNSNDIIINSSGSLNSKKIYLGEGFISSNQSHYYSLRLKSDHCDKLKFVVEVENE